jgi:putative spermidine/putrescine transport system ATP-binding protein
LKSLQQSLGITFVFVTHDQGEALSMADRLAVFNEGRIQQLGTPEEVYNQPKTRFVADFVGSSNVLSAKLCRKLGLTASFASLRPEAVAIAPPINGALSLSGTVASRSFLGATNRIVVDVEDGRIAVASPAAQGIPAIGSPVTISFAARDLYPMEDA